MEYSKESCFTSTSGLFQILLINYNTAGVVETNVMVENTYPAMIGITDDQGAMCFLSNSHTNLISASYRLSLYK